MSNQNQGASIEAERASFEAEVRKVNDTAEILERWPGGAYKHHGMEGRWQGWLMCRRTTSPASPGEGLPPLPIKQYEFTSPKTGWFTAEQMRSYARAAIAADRAQQAGAAAPSVDWVSDVVRDVAELPDRDSPEDQPEMMLVTGNELRNIIATRVPVELSATGAAGASIDTPEFRTLLGAQQATEEACSSDGSDKNRDAANEAWDALIAHIDAHNADLRAQLARQGKVATVSEIVDVLMYLDANGLLAWRGTGDDEADAENESEAKARTAHEVVKAMNARRAAPTPASAQPAPLGNDAQAGSSAWYSCPRCGTTHFQGWQAECMRCNRPVPRPAAPQALEVRAVPDEVRQMAEFIVKHAVADHTDTNGPDFRACACCDVEIPINSRTYGNLRLEHKDDCLFIKAQTMLAASPTTTTTVTAPAQHVEQVAKAERAKELIGQYRMGYRNGYAEGKAEIAAPAAQQAAPTELHVGVSNNDQGVHINIMQRHADGSATLIYAAKAPEGDSYGRVSIAAPATAGMVPASEQREMPYYGYKLPIQRKTDKSDVVRICDATGDTIFDLNTHTQRSLDDVAGLAEERKGAEDFADFIVQAVNKGAGMVGQDAKDAERVRDYKPGEWFDARTLDEMQAFYLSRLPAIREAAKEHGYAIGLHGSTRRDFDLMAMQWRANASPKDELAHAIAVAACGITRDGTHPWEVKPNGRFAVSIPICWTDHANPEFGDKPSLGHIDLSVIDPSWMILFIDKRAEDYLSDYAETDHGTGSVVFHRGEAGREYHSTLVELADDLRASMAAQQAQASAADQFCDANCTWADHAPGCVRAQASAKKDGGEHV